MEEDLTVIKSLIAISSGGLALERIEREFREMNGSSLNYRKYGFKTLQDMLQSSKEIVLKSTSTGIVCRVNDAKIAHVTSLVDRTKKSKPKKKASRSKSAYYQTSRGGYSSPQRYGIRQGSTNSPSRRPFYPSNRMQHDGSYRSRPQSVGRIQNANSSQSRYYRTSRYQPNCAPSTSCAYNSNYDKGRRPESKPVQSSSIGSSGSQLKAKGSSSPEWSSDSSEHHEQPRTVLSSVGWTSRPAVERTLTEVEHPKSKAPSVCVKTNSIPAPVQVKTCSNRISDWSSDSGSASSLKGVSKGTVLHSGVKRSSVPVQNQFISSTSKAQSSPEGAKENGIQSKFNSSSDWSTDSSDHEYDQPRPSKVTCSKLSSSRVSCPEPSSVDSVYINPPLMVGGVGRGRSRPNVDLVRPGKNEAKAYESPSKEVVVTGSPSKRETSTTITNGLPSILIKLRNEPASQFQRPKQLKNSLQKPTIASYQFIGDFLLHKVAEVSLGLKFPTKGGLCHNRATIMDCLEEVKRNQNQRPVVLMIGMTDILEGATFEEMKHRMTLLLQKLSARNIVLLTLPVLPIFMKETFDRELSVLEKFNGWLLSLKLPTTIETERYLYCDSPFYAPRFGASGLENFSEEGCWVVHDEIMAAI